MLRFIFVVMKKSFGQESKNLSSNPVCLTVTQSHSSSPFPGKKWKASGKYCVDVTLVILWNPIAMLKKLLLLSQCWKMEAQILCNFPKVTKALYSGERIRFGFL
jgi:hypothetical protein